MTTFDDIRQQLIGQHTAVPTPFGQKPLVYADATASGRALSGIEDYITSSVLPYYANTHSESSYTGMHTGALREQARQQIAASLGATDDYAVIFAGAGATAAINKWVQLLKIQPQSNTVVILGPYEHHSNELPWRELGVTVVNAGLNDVGEVDLVDVERLLAKHQGANIIGSFSAASNVTGIKTPLAKLAQLFKDHDALLGIDYAAAAPYVAIDLEALQIDAAFISTHKFVGGPSTPGILAVKRKHVCTNSAPTVAGGGTVRYVDPQRHWYVDSVERREEAGTPAIVDSIRAGLAFKVKSDLGHANIEAREDELTEMAMAALNAMPNVTILGGDQAKRLPIFSITFSHQGQPIHYGLIVALLNDLFGIQVRGGCSCAGPYAHYLLGLSEQEATCYEGCTAGGKAGYRPGWVRFNLHYLMDQVEVDYLLGALSFVAANAQRFMASYDFEQKSGVWRYTQSVTHRPVLGQPTMTAVAQTFDGCQEQAQQLLDGLPVNSECYQSLPEGRWFLLAEDAI